MKTKLSILAGLANRSREVLLAVLVLLTATIATRSHAAAFGDPTVNDWDFVVSGGGQDGIMFLHFTKDLDPNSGLPTFEGVLVYAGKKAISVDPRSQGIYGRTNTIGTPGWTNLFGGSFIEGVSGTVADNGGSNDWFPDSTGLRSDWFYNAKGQLVGSFFTVIFLDPSNTNGITNNVSFVGNLSTKRLTLKASSGFGGFSAVGVPLVATTAPVEQAPWSATRNVAGNLYLETFSMLPSGITNMFLLQGSGPSYTYSDFSFCLISSQKKIALSIGEVGGVPITTGTFGNFTANKKSISMKTGGLMSGSTNHITFNGAQVVIP